MFNVLRTEIRTKILPKYTLAIEDAIIRKILNISLHVASKQLKIFMNNKIEYVLK